MGGGADLQLFCLILLILIKNPYYAQTSVQHTLTTFRVIPVTLIHQNISFTVNKQARNRLANFRVPILTRYIRCGIATLGTRDGRIRSRL